MNLSKILFKNWKERDYLFFFVLIPIILLVIFLLPPTFKNYLILNPSAPNVISIFMMNYTHSTIGHLFNNLFGYLIVLFLIFNFESNRNRFYVFSWFNLFLMPLILYLLFKITLQALNIPVFPPSQGFSGIAAGFAGYLLFSAIRFSKRRYDKSITWLSLSLLLIINIAIFSFFHSNKLFLVSLIFSAFLIFICKKQIIKVSKGIYNDIVYGDKRKIKINYYKFVVLVLAIVFLFHFYQLASKEIIVGNSIINTPYHLFGYLLGVAFPLFTSKELFTKMKTKSKITEDQKRVIKFIMLIITIVSIFLTYYQIEYPKLIVNETIVDNGDGTGRLKIYVENNALIKATGTINFFRLDINPNIPHMQINSLKPGENITFDTEIRISEKNYSFQENDLPPFALSSYKIPVYKLYFITEEISISYKISCDNCYPQGILRRVPELGSIQTSFLLDPLTGEMSGKLKIYDWTKFDIDDL